MWKSFDLLVDTLLTAEAGREYLIAHGSVILLLASSLYAEMRGVRRAVEIRVFARRRGVS